MSKLSQVEQRFLSEIRHHFAGWKDKIRADFSEAAYNAELKSLQGDQVYEPFGFAVPAYVLTRLVGRISISVGRRLGEIYDKVPQMAAASRFGFRSDEVVVKVRDKLLLDINLPFSSPRLSADDRSHIISCVKKHVGIDVSKKKGIGMEVRYNFNPNDSSRLRKDCDMASYLTEDGLCPIYLVFSSISPREEAIARLTRAGWNFLVGDKAIQYMRDLVEMDFEAILRQPSIKQEVAREVGEMMDLMLRSPAFQASIGDIYDLKAGKV